MEKHSIKVKNIHPPVTKDGRGWNPQIISPTGKPFQILSFSFQNYKMPDIKIHLETLKNEILAFCRKTTSDARSSPVIFSNMI